MTTSQLSTKQRGTTAIWILSLSPLLWLACHRSLPLVSGPDRIGPHHADAASGITPDGAGEAGSDSAADRRPDTGAPSDGAPDAGDGGVALDAPSPCPIDRGPACAIPHTLLTCDDGVGCTAAVCAPGYANCDVSNPACETPIAATPAASGACVPQYQGTRQVSDGRYQDSATAVAADGSFFLGGTFTGTVDFDPSAGTDLRTAGDADGYITKLNADGSYAWTATLIGPTGITLAALAATPAGGVVATGTYSVSIDLDPGPGTDLHRTNGSATAIRSSSSSAPTEAGRGEPRSPVTSTSREEAAPASPSTARARPISPGRSRATSTSIRARARVRSSRRLPPAFWSS